MGLKRVIESIIALIFLGVYIFIFLMVFFGTLAKANNMYHVWKVINILIALFDTVLLFTILNLWLFGGGTFKVSVTLLGVIFILIIVAAIVSDKMGMGYPQI
jgi:hypothetical protein